MARKCPWAKKWRNGFQSARGQKSGESEKGDGLAKMNIFM